MQVFVNKPETEFMFMKVFKCCHMLLEHFLH